MAALKEHDTEKAGKKSYGLRQGKRIYEGYAGAFPEGNVALPEDFRNVIVCADSEEYLAGLPDNCIEEKRIESDGGLFVQNGEWREA